MVVFKVVMGGRLLPLCIAGRAGQISARIGLGQSQELPYAWFDQSNCGQLISPSFAHYLSTIAGQTKTKISTMLSALT